MITKTKADLDQKEVERAQMIGDLDDWVAVFAENELFDESKKLDHLVQPDTVICKNENIAGVTVPAFQELTFKDIDYDVDDYPLWVDTAIIKLREIARLDALVSTLRKQEALLEKELRSTSQRVNLFEKVKIPEAKENIRMIGVFLGDQQTAAVVRGKISKKKLVEMCIRDSGIPMIDVFNTLVESQKLPIFSISGEPYNALLSRIALQAEVDVIAVSYTHLDVYKRQVPTFIHNTHHYFLFLPEYHSPPDSGKMLSAVSYPSSQKKSWKLSLIHIYRNP